ncbi:MAG: hypothetical protein MUC65_05770, partial [Pontiellaceae bacterium]|nr:hypothetical protein [Pontiellaceae bacterium]
IQKCTGFCSKWMPNNASFMTCYIDRVSRFGTQETPASTLTSDDRIICGQNHLGHRCPASTPAFL